MKTFFLLLPLFFYHAAFAVADDALCLGAVTMRERGAGLEVALFAFRRIRQ